MNALQRSFTAFKVLGVPCNQFWYQEPGANGTEILASLKHVRPGGGFEPAFELTEKAEVNGPNEHPMYTYLKSYCPPTSLSFAPKERYTFTEFRANDVRWNFEKFLIDKRGVPVIRYSPNYEPADIQRDIQHLLMAPEGYY